MRKTLSALSFLIAGAFFGNAISLIREARADKTITLLSSAAVIDSMTFNFTTPTIVLGTVCAHTTDSLANVQDTSCTTTVLPAGAFRTNVLALSPTALTFWKTQNGL